MKGVCCKGHALAVFACLCACGSYEVVADDEIVATIGDPSDPFADTDPPEMLSYQDSVETLVWPGGERHVDMFVHGWRYRTLIVSTTDAGHWEFTTRTDFAGASTCYQEIPALIVGTYWRDRDIPDDPWHFWPGGGVVCWPFPLFSTELYAGSHAIEFAFVYGNWSATPVRVYATFVPDER